MAAVLALAGCAEAAQQADSAPLPRPNAPLPREPGALAAALTSTSERLRNEIEAWTRGGDPSRGAPPEPVTLLALHHQRIYRLLGTNRRLARGVLARLPRHVAGEARDTIAARRALEAIPPSGNLRPRIRVGPAQAAGRLRRHYAAAQRRFGVQWYVLASVNFIESSFGRLRNLSTAGARGPMQFIPSTWRAYGMGGNIEDPRDAILGAANYLRASGAPRRLRRALFAYNHSSHYVDAVLRYASRMRRDPRAFYAYYSWQVYARTSKGIRRLSGPARD